MEVLLLKDVDGLGLAGEIKKVADGYGRNYLIPRGLAEAATQGARKQLEDTLRQRAHKVRLAQTGNALEQRVAAGEQAGHHAVDDRGVADDDLRDLGDRMVCLEDQCARPLLQEALRIREAILRVQQPVAEIRHRINGVDPLVAEVVDGEETGDAAEL